MEIALGMASWLMGMVFDGSGKQTFVASAEVSGPGQTLVCSPSDSGNGSFPPNCP